MKCDQVLRGWPRCLVVMQSAGRKGSDADVDYVDRRSLFLDLGILVRTSLSVLRREGISAAGDVTMPEFTGSVTTDQSI